MREVLFLVIGIALGWLGHMFMRYILSGRPQKEWVDHPVDEWPEEALRPHDKDKPVTRHSLEPEGPFQGGLRKPLNYKDE